MNPVGVCKESVVLLQRRYSHYEIRDCASCFGTVPPFCPRGSLVLYADRSQSLGRRQLSLVCQVAMQWSRPGGERPKVQ